MVSSLRSLLSLLVSRRLSGGAYLGYYHMGVIKALFAEGLLPRVISGASAGSIMTALIG